MYEVGESPAFTLAMMTTALFKPVVSSIEFEGYIRLVSRILYNLQLINYVNII